MKILLVDDEPEVADIVSLAFSFHRPEYQVVKADNGWDALRKFETEQPDMVILDIAMPGLTGFDVIRKLRESSDAPIIFLTAKGLQDDKVEGLELGADDYIVKPFGPKELMARVDAVMRRASAEPNGLSTSEYLSLRVDFKQRRASFEGEELDLIQPSVPSFIT